MMAMPREYSDAIVMCIVIHPVLKLTGVAAYNKEFFDTHPCHWQGWGKEI